MQILGPELHREAECEAVLRSLPEWFGIEHALRQYAHDSGVLPTFAAAESDRLLGFLTLREHFPAAWEVHCIAVSARDHRRGLGTALLAHAEQWLLTRGAEFLQVKTIAPSHTSAPYAQTRQFYLNRGFTPLEVFPTLWRPENPALQMIKRLHAT